MGAAAAGASERPCFGGLAAVGRAGAAGDDGLAAAMRSEPIRVAIAGAAGQIGYSLLPMIAKGEMFGQARRVVLQCLDLNLPQVTENMRGIEMELQDGNFPLLHEAVFTIDDAQAFKAADYAILLGAYPQQEGKDRREVMDKNSMIFRTIGNAINKFASKNCKVLAVGHPACTNALLCAYYAPSLPKDNFFGLTRLDQNRAVGQIAHRAHVNVSEVRNIIVWGSHARLADLGHGTIKGQPILMALSREEDKQWLNDAFVTESQQRGANIHAARKASSAMSAARAIVDHIRDLHLGTRPSEFTSMGVWSDGNEYDVAQGLIFSMPVVCTGQGRRHVARGLCISEQTRGRIREAEEELLADRELAKEFLRKHGVPLE